MLRLVRPGPQIDVGPELMALSPPDATIESSRNVSWVVVGSLGVNVSTGILRGWVGHIARRGFRPFAMPWLT